MSGVAVGNLDNAVGIQLSQANPWNRVEYEPTVVVGDLVEAHAPFTPPHAPTPTMAEGVDWYRINGTPICVEGHKATCGHETTGRHWYRVIE
ncbi:MAG: hypothetical protein ACRBHB_18160 [Arenicella sp.]